MDTRKTPIESEFFKRAARAKIPPHPVDIPKPAILNPTTVKDVVRLELLKIAIIIWCILMCCFLAYRFNRYWNNVDAFDRNLEIMKSKNKRGAASDKELALFVDAKNDGVRHFIRLFFFD